MLKKIQLFLLSTALVPTLVFSGGIKMLKKEFQDKFSALQDVAYAEETTFSGSQMSVDLEALIPLAKQIGEDSQEMVRLLELQTDIFQRRNMDVEATQTALKVLVLDDQLKIYYKERKEAERSLFYGWASLYAERAGLYDEALKLGQKGLAIVEEDNASLDRKIILKRNYGFILHEAGRFEAARQYNLETLAYLEKVKDSSEEKNWRLEREKLITNLAQNAYELKDFSSAEKYLNQRLALTETHLAEFESERIDTYFQLGVLAAERGDQVTAKAQLDKMLDLAKASGKDSEIKSAEQRMAYWEENYQN